MEINLDKVKKVHFIGIGGIGVSAIARLMHVSGKSVSGSDMSESHITENLRQFDIKIHIGHNEENIPQDVDLIIHTIAIPENNLEMMKARKRGVDIATYPQVLSLISRNMKTIAVAGTHGKTTTTAMLSKVLIEADIDPTVIVGSLMKDQDSNLIVGKSDYFVVEACEYRRSFLNLYPQILIITNIDTDHLDYYKDIADIQSAFRELALRVPKDGVVICNTNDLKIIPVIADLECIVMDYIPFIDPNLRLKAPGEHNRQNAGACLAMASFLGLEKERALEALGEFNGTWRRFDLQGKTQSGAVLYDDYAHHPQEIIATLSGMKEMYPHKKRVAFFQPHLFSRTKLLLNEFSQAFTDVDEVHILPIYAAREEFDSSINSKMIVDGVQRNSGNGFTIETFGEATQKINQFEDDTVVILMGAGNIYTLSELALGTKETF